MSDAQLDFPGPPMHDNLRKVRFIVGSILSLFVSAAWVDESAPAGDRATRAKTTLAEIIGNDIRKSETGNAPQAPPPDLVREWEKIRYAISQEQFGDALRLIDDLERGCSIGHVPFQLEKAELLLRTGRVDQARAITHHADVTANNSPRLQYLLGDIAIFSGNRARAIEYFRTATLFEGEAKADPYVTGAWYRLADTLSREGFMRAAAEAYLEFDRRIWGLYPEHRFAAPVRELMPDIAQGTLRQQRELWLEIGMPQEALAAAAELRLIRPDDVDVTRHYVEGLLDAGEQEKAFDVALEALAAENAGGEDDLERLRPLLAAVAKATNRQEEAKKVLAWVDRSASHTKQTLICTHLAHTFAIQNKLDYADQFWERAKKDSRHRAVAIAEQTILRSTTESRAEAEELLAAELEAGYPPGLLLYFLEDDGCKDAPNSDEVENAAGEPSAAALLARAMLALRAGEPARAQSLVMPLRDDESAYALPAALVSAAARIAEYDWKGAQAILSPVLRKYPQSGEAQFLAAQAHRGWEEPEKALEAFQAAVTLLPENAAVSRSLGEYLLARGAREALRAQRYLQMAVAADPYDAEAAELLLESYLSGDSPKLELGRGVLARAARGAWPDDALRRMETRIRFVAEPWSAAHLEALETQFQEFPQDVKTALRLVEGRLHRSQFAEALMLATAIRQRCPESERALRAYAQAQRFNLNFSVAADTMRALTERYPRSVHDHIELADYLSWDGQGDEAIRTLESLLKATEDARNGATILLNLISTCANHREYQTALRARAEYGPKFPEIDWDQQQITVFVMAGRANDALAQLQRKLAANPGDEQTRTLIFAVCMQAQRPDEARAFLEKWLEDANGANALAYRDRLLQALLELKDYDAALRVAQDFRAQLVRLGVGLGVLPYIQVREAVAFLGLNDSSRALQLFREALRDSAVIEDLGMRETLENTILQALIEAKQFDSAFAMLDEWSRRDDASVGNENERMLALRQSVLQAAGRTQEYLAIAQRRYDRNPVDPFLNNDFGYSLADEGVRLDEALRMIRLAVAHEPGNAAYLDSLGWVYYKLNQMSEAVTYLGRAVSLHNGQDPVLYDHYGDALYHNGAATEAVAAWQQAVKVLDEPVYAAVANDDPKLRSRVEAKLAAVEAGDKPSVAAIPGDG
ncbi:MAG: tetratricopeptide repeat protein [Phycisphaerae bacterium]